MAIPAIYPLIFMKTFKRSKTRLNPKAVSANKASFQKEVFSRSRQQEVHT